jgi:predicted nucleic-acid-binding protein
MIGLDMNVLVRLLVDDDATQVRQAREFMSHRCGPDNPGFVDRVALCEMVWVLSAGYGYGKADIAAAIHKLLGSRDVLLEDAESVHAALRAYRTSGVDFADALIGEVNRARGCEATASFDRMAAKLNVFVGIRT